MKQMCRLILGSFLLCVTLTVNAYSTATVNGITWKYEVINGAASLYGEFTSNGGYPSIPQTTKGPVSIPASLGGYAVKWIGNYAFFACSGLTSVTIPDSVTWIGADAFSGCSGLTSVTIPVSVTSIAGAFNGCNSLKSVTIPQYVCNSRMSYTFPAAYQSITNVIISDSVTSIATSAFNGCSGLKSVTIPQYVCNSKMSSVFPAAYQSIMNVIIYDGVTSIGHDAFCDCTNLTSVIIPNSVTSIEARAFYGCSSSLFDTTTILGVKLVDGWAVGTTESLPGDLNLTGIRGIGHRAFYGCNGLTSVTIPDNVTSIATSAFDGCSGLLSITVGSGNANYSSANGLLLSKDGKTLVTGVNGDVSIPDGVTSIEDSAFSGYSGLKSVTIPDSVTSIATSAFSGCSGLLSITVEEGNSNYSSTNGLLLSKDGKTLVQGVNGDVLIPDGVTRIEDSAFNGRNELTSVAIPNSVTSIATSAFSDCSGLKSVTIPQYVCDYGPSVDSPATWSGRPSIVFPAANSTITNVVIADGVTNIGCYAFGEFGSLTSVTIPDSVTDIGDYAFDGCYSLTSVTIPDSVTDIGFCAFAHCYSLTNVTIPDNISNLSSDAFDGCGKLWVAWFKTLVNASSGIGNGENVGSKCDTTVNLTVTNVVVHYMATNVPSTAVVPPTTSGIVNIISEVSAGAAVAIPSEWAAQYPNFQAKFGNDFTIAITRPTGKVDGAGNSMMVWQDFVAGTDPTNPADVFTASITFDKNTNRPIISWTPELSPAEAAKRTYRTYGKVRLNDPNWTEINGNAEDYNFFKVSVEMR